MQRESMQGREERPESNEEARAERERKVKRPNSEPGSGSVAHEKERRKVEAKKRGGMYFHHFLIFYRPEKINNPQLWESNT